MGKTTVNRQKDSWDYNFNTLCPVCLKLLMHASLTELPKNVIK